MPSLDAHQAWFAALSLLMVAAVLAWVEIKKRERAADLVTERDVAQADQVTMTAELQTLTAERDQALAELAARERERDELRTELQSINAAKC